MNAPPMGKRRDRPRRAEASPVAKCSPLALDGASLGREDLAPVASGAVRLELTAAARKCVARARAVVDSLVEKGETAYGINTGFGRFCRVRILPAQVKRLQANLVRSHGAGVGDPLPEPVVRLALAFRANALARGHSGIRLATLDRLLDLYNHGILPSIPAQGSVGASGDLAPLAHMAQVLIGEGQATVDGRLHSGAAALRKRGLEPVILEAKEGLSLINGVQISAAIFADALLRADRVLDAADVVSAITLDALLGSVVPLDARIHGVRPHPGQALVAARVRSLLEKSELNLSHKDCDRVQDAYSLRCVPQVHGAVRDAIAFAWRTLLTEINSSTDNPLVFFDDGSILSGGNFHGAPIGYAADLAAIVLTDLGSISERRLERLVNPDLSGLPPFLSRREGLESGLMIAQVTAAALTSENKVLSHPASVDSIPTSAGTEDHVSMSTHGARKARDVVANVERILAIEALAAVTALELRRPLRSGAPLERYVARFREHVPRRTGDRDLREEIEAAALAIRSGLFTP